MSDNAYIQLTRERSLSNMLRGYSVIIDEQSVDKIKSGETKRYALPSGPHVVRMSVDFYKSVPLEVHLRPGETLTLECGEGGPKTLKESLSLKGLGQNLQGIASPGDYLYVKIVGDTHASAPQPKSDMHRDERRASPERAPRPARDFGIFISYRREDSRAFTGRIADRLTQHFGPEAVFRDVDSIPLGMDFRQKIEQTMSQADAVLVIIGKQWADVGAADGTRRLDQAEDFVRLEIESAIAREIPVIPVLVDDAEMPSTEELPQSIAPLAYRNAIFIPREPYFHAGVDKVIEALDGMGSAKAPASSPKRRFCTGCGVTLAATQKFCTGCGKRAAI